jgi:hypothetical protein
MLGVALTLTILFLLLASSRLFAEVVCILGADPSGEAEYLLDSLITKIQNFNICNFLKILLVLGIVVWIYSYGFILCSQLIFASSVALYWPQRYFK